MPRTAGNFFDDEPIDPGAIDNGREYDGGSDGSGNSVDGGSGSETDERGDENNVGTSGDAPRTRRRRSDAGKPRGPRNPGQRGKENRLDIGGISSLLFGVHYSLSTMAQVPEAALSKDECDLLAQLIANVERHYPRVMSAKYVDIGALSTSAAAIYFSHYMAWRMRVEGRTAPQYAEAAE